MYNNLLSWVNCWVTEVVFFFFFLLVILVSTAQSRSTSSCQPIRREERGGGRGACRGKDLFPGHYIRERTLYTATPTVTPPEAFTVQSRADISEMAENREKTTDQMKMWKESRGSQVCRSSSAALCRSSSAVWRHSVLLEKVGDRSSGDTAAASSIFLVNYTRLSAILVVVVVEEEGVVMLSYCVTCLCPFLNGTNSLRRSSPTVSILQAS